MSITVDQVTKARDQWIAAVRALDIEKTICLYEPNQGILLGTLDTKETKSRLGKERIRGYFEHFLANDVVVPLFPQEVTENDIQQLGENHVIFNGYYDFELEKEGKKRIAHAKFSYLYKLDSAGELIIMTHNSGLTPEGIKEL